MSDYVSASHVVLGCSASTVDEVLKLLSEQAVSFGIATDAEALCEAFKAREAEGTTGMMGGFAIPHAKSDAVTQAAIIVDKFDEGVVWPSMDDAPITCAIALLTPASEAGTTHLQLLSKVARAPHERGLPHERPGRRRPGQDRGAHQRGHRRRVAT